MMVQVLRVFSVVAVLALAVEAQAADPFRVANHSAISTSSLEAMGLGGITPLSQHQASEIRGQGGVVWGNSYASSRAGSHFATSKNGYHATGKNGAFGVNGSIAVSAAFKYGKVTSAGVAAAGGFSYARSF